MLIRLRLGVLAVVAASIVPGPAGQATFPSHHEGRIAYVDKTPLGTDIFTVRPDGADRLRLTHSGRARNPRYDATGRLITYESSRDIWMMNADGSGQTKLVATNALERDPGWSPDGQWIVYASDQSGRLQIHLFSFATGDSSQLTFPGEALKSAWAPAWSPDGTRIAFVGRVPSGLAEDSEPYFEYWELLMTVRPDGTDLQQLTKDYHVQKPDWTPNSNRILYTNFRGWPYNENACPKPTFSIRSDGTGLRRISKRWCYEWGAIRSPEGRRMAIFRDANRLPFPSLYVTDADGTNPVRIVANLPFDRGFDWQP